MSDATQSKLNTIRCALTGAVVLAVLFAVCWVAAAAGVAGGSHMYISLFTLAPAASVVALGVGLCWSVASGAATGALIAIAYNAFGVLERRPATPQRAARA